MTVRFHDAVVPPAYLLRTRGGGVLAQLTRFTLVGTSSNVLYALAFFTLDVYGSFLTGGHLLTPSRGESLFTP
jgi:hypothetical protein